MSRDEQQPVLFLSHGGGPSFFLDARSFPMLKGMDKDSHAASFLRNLVQHVGLERPSAILVFSAHWVEKSCAVTSGSKTSLYYDYGGFPPETYEIQWPVPGAPEVAKKVVGLLTKHGIQFIQVSLLSTMDIGEHMKLAEALTEIRQANVLVVGSGFGTHSGLRDTSPAPWALRFQTLIHDIVTNPSYTPDQRKSKLISLAQEDCYKQAHSPPDHFLPVAMCIAVTGYKPGKILLSEFVSGSLLNDHYMFN